MAKKKSKVVKAKFVKRKVRRVKRFRVWEVWDLDPLSNDYYHSTWHTSLKEAEKEIEENYSCDYIAPVIVEINIPARIY